MNTLTTLLVATTLYLQTSTNPLTANNAAITGIVRNANNGEPLVDVRITISPDDTVAPASAATPTVTPTRTTTTDIDGRFTLSRVAAGRYRLAAAKSTFFRPRRNGGTVAITIGPNERTDNIQVLLMPASAISGRIVDENHTPLKGVRVEALKTEYRGGAKLLTSAGQGLTDDHGEYRLFDLQPGTYYIRAVRRPERSTDGLSSYYPGVSEPQNEGALRLDAASQRGGVDFALQERKGVTIQFRIDGNPGDSTPAIMLQRRDLKIDETPFVHITIIADHVYRISGLHEGAYELTVQLIRTSPDQATVTHSAMVPLDISDRDRDLGTIPLRPSLTVAGHIHASAQAPPIDLTGITVMLRPLGFPLLSNTPLRSTTGPNNNDGSFMMRSVPVGRYQVIAIGLPANTYLVDARAAGHDVLDAGYVVGVDDDSLEVFIGGADSVGSVEGVVINTRGEPVPATTVVLIPSPERRGNPAAFRTVVSDQRGNFLVREVRRGEYKILAWEDIEPGAYMDQQFLKDYETLGEKVRVAPGETRALIVNVSPQK